MKRTDLYVGVIALVVFFAGAGYILLYKGDSPSTAVNNENAPLFSYTREEVAIHNSSTSCWSIVENSVYDLTSWIKNHPGGPEAISAMCGKDATELFNSQHGGQSNPLQALEQHNIGSLK